MVRDEIRQAIASALSAAQADGSLPAFEPFTVEILRPKQADHGDYSSNVAMVAAAALRKTGANINPRSVAELIAAHVPADGPIGSVEIAGPGFINLRLSERWLQEQTQQIVLAGDKFGNITRGNGERWQVEDVSANPTGPIHYGGARNAVLGDSLATVLAAAGSNVQREFYVNDAGTQFHLFTVTLYARYAQLLGFDIPVPEEGYQGEYMIGYARGLSQNTAPASCRWSGTRPSRHSDRSGAPSCCRNSRRSWRALGSILIAGLANSRSMMTGL
ncbi:MAG: arginine--tRNA ligase [Anaerolineales bacterium]|nr:arginine--tRNA ligase [Anaerolineales bacterium]